MMLPKVLVRFARLSRSKQLVLAEGFVMLGLASAAIRLLPFRRVVAAAGLWSGATRARGWSDGTVCTVQWAIRTCAKRVPWKAVCFQRGLALHLMLRRRGAASVLHYGVSQAGIDGLSAHVWVSLDGRDVIGGEQAPGFTCLASYPAKSAE